MPEARVLFPSTLLSFGANREGCYKFPEKADGGRFPVQGFETGKFLAHFRESASPQKQDLQYDLFYGQKRPHSKSVLRPQDAHLSLCCSLPKMSQDKSPALCSQKIIPLLGFITETKDIFPPSLPEVQECCTAPNMATNNPFRYQKSYFFTCK